MISSCYRHDVHTSTSSSSSSWCWKFVIEIHCCCYTVELWRKNKKNALSMIFFTKARSHLLAMMIFSKARSHLLAMMIFSKARSHASIVDDLRERERYRERHRKRQRQRQRQREGPPLCYPWSSSSSSSSRKVGCICCQCSSSSSRKLARSHMLSIIFSSSRKLTCTWLQIEQIYIRQAFVDHRGGHLKFGPLSFPEVFSARKWTWSTIILIARFLRALTIPFDLRQWTEEEEEDSSVYRSAFSPAFSWPRIDHRQVNEEDLRDLGTCTCSSVKDARECFGERDLSIFLLLGRGGSGGAGAATMDILGRTFQRRWRWDEYQQYCRSIVLCLWRCFVIFGRMFKNIQNQVRKSHRILQKESLEVIIFRQWVPVGH